MLNEEGKWEKGRDKERGGEREREGSRREEVT